MQKSKKWHKIIKYQLKILNKDLKIVLDKIILLMIKEYHDYLIKQNRNKF